MFGAERLTAVIPASPRIFVYSEECRMSKILTWPTGFSTRTISRKACSPSRDRSAKNRPTASSGGLLPFEALNPHYQQ